MMDTPTHVDAPLALTVRISDSARLLGIGKTKIYELIGTGEIETIKLGRATLVIRTSLDDLVERRRQVPARDRI